MLSSLCSDYRNKVNSTFHNNGRWKYLMLGDRKPGKYLTKTWAKWYLEINFKKNCPVCSLLLYLGISKFFRKAPMPKVKRPRSPSALNTGTYKLLILSPLWNKSSILYFSIALLICIWMILNWGQLKEVNEKSSIQQHRAKHCTENLPQ